MTNESYNMDCMEYMAGIEDNFFDLAIVDPMYIMPKCYYSPGSEKSGKTGVNRKHIKQAIKLSGTTPIGWDYLKEIQRVSIHQIIWGINTFKFAGYTPGRIVWDKKNDASSFSDCEIASSTFHVGIKIFRYRWSGFLQENMKNKEKRIHAFQKPVALYKWLLTKYAKPGDTILDTHLGSGSSRIAAYDMGFDFTGIELDLDYFNDQEERFKNHIAQGALFPVEEITKSIYHEKELF